MTDPLSRVHKCLLPTGSGPLSLEELEDLGRQRRPASFPPSVTVRRPALRPQPLLQRLQRP